MTKKVAVLLGGKSAEREVSMKSGNEVYNSLSKLGYNVVKIDPQDNLLNQLHSAKPDIVFNALHGTYGEDGAIPGLLETLGIPYTHSGIMPSAIGMNKNMTKKIIQHHGVRVPEWVVTNIQEIRKALTTNTHPLKPPYVVKPIQQGSSVGIYIFDGSNADDVLGNIAEDKWAFGEEVMVEKYIPGKELSTAVVDNKAVGTILLKSGRFFRDYVAKYTYGVEERIYPAPIPPEIDEEAKHFAEVVHNTLCCRTISRSDLRYDDTENGDGKLYFLEINTHPGFTPISLLPEIAKHHGISFDDIVEMLIKDAKCEIKP